MGKQAKHTPGPFAVAKVVSDEAVDIVLDYYVPELGNPVLIGSTYFDDTTKMPGISIEEAKATAILFAAAPDLLAVCKAFIRGMEDTFPGGVSSVREDSLLGRAWRDGIAAVAKAEGGDTC